MNNYRKTPNEEMRVEFSKLSLIADMGSKMLKATTVDHLLSLILKQTVEVMNADACIIWLNDRSGNLMPKICYGLNLRTIDKFKIRFGSYLVRKAMEKDGADVIYNLKTCKLPVLGNVIKREKIESLVSAPLIVEGHRIGVLMIFSRSRRIFHKSDLKILDALAGQSALAITNLSFYEKMDNRIKDKAKEMSMLFTMSRSVYSTVDPNLLLDLILEKMRILIGAKFCTLRLRDKVIGHGAHASQVGLVNACIRPLAKFEKAVANKLTKYGTVSIVSEMGKAFKGKVPAFFQKKKINIIVAISLFSKNRRVGTLCAYLSGARKFDREEIEMLEMVSGLCSMAIENSSMFERIRKDYLNMIKTLAKIIDANDPYTRGHCDKVMKYSLLISKRLNLPEKTLNTIRTASLLHDIGKIGLDLSMLRKAGKLSDKEWEKIRMHSDIGAQIVGRAGFLNDIVPIIRHHHARYEGGGYPDPGISGDRIPLGARILSVADSFDAMTRDRPYRKAMSREEAMKELIRCSGTQFDPSIVSAFAGCNSWSHH